MSHLKSYHQEVWRLISNFQAFNINVVLRTCNATTNALENTTSQMSMIRDIFTIEIFYKPSILYNITNLHVFNDDQQILHFMANTNIFKYVATDDDKNECSLQAETGNMKGHLIRKGVATLENIYDLQECF